MAVKRNDPCPCGSGKKYKKCCLKKENVIQLAEHKEERFFRLKHKLVNELGNFYDKKLSVNEYFQLQTEFRDRTNRVIPPDMEKGFFIYWLHFFHRFENGMRGIEWYYSENQSRMETEEKELTEKWTKLEPRLVQAIDHSRERIMFEDIHTNEKFPFSKNEENIPDFVPWYGTFSLIESFDELYYFNGVRVLGSPDKLQKAIAKTEELTAQHNLTHKQVLIDYYPEVLAAFIADEPTEEKEFSKDFYAVAYEIKDVDMVIENLRNNPEIVVDQWEEDSKKLSWVGDWKVYKDSEMDGQVQVADLYGSIKLDNNKLLATCYNKDRVEDLKVKLSEIPSAISIINEETHSTKVPYGMEFRNQFFQLSEGTPKYFALYAQTYLRMKIDQPIAKLDNYSLKQLIDQGKIEIAERWLKQLEYNTYLMSKDHYGEVEVTADFNTIRKSLNLPLSPFVTGSAGRESTVEFKDSNSGAKNSDSPILDKDLPYYQELGFVDQSTESIFAEDLVEFFKERTEGKAESTARKYRKSLNAFRSYLEKRDLSSWGQCDLEFWEQFLTKDYFDMHESVSKTQWNDFLSTIKAFAKWIDHKYETTISTHVMSVAKESKSLVGAGK